MSKTPNAIGSMRTSGPDATLRSNVDAVSPVPGAKGWSYGAFGNEVGDGLIAVPLVRQDGEQATFKVPDFLSEPQDINRIALIVIAARERWEDREGVGG